MNQKSELRQTILGAAGFFLVLCSYYILRPVRDEMAVQFGADRIQWLFSATFAFTLMIVPVFGWAVRNIARQRVLVCVYSFLVLNLLFFMVAFALWPGVALATAFFVWLSSFNLFVVSLFWSRLGDVFSKEQSYRRYGVIAAGGTAGAIAGPALTAAIATHVSSAGLVGFSSVLLTLATVCLGVMRSGKPETDLSASRPIGGRIIAGVLLTIRHPGLRSLALLIICYTMVSTVLYVELVDLAAREFQDSGERKAFFAKIDLTVNVAALTLQVLGTRALVQRAGLRTALTVMPVLLLLGSSLLGAGRTVFAVAGLQAVHRAGEYAFNRPGREMIYTTVDPESRYKAKSFIDTVVYRGSDAGSAWIIAALRSAGADAMVFAAVPAALAWILIAWFLGKRHDR